MLPQKQRWQNGPWKSLRRALVNTVSGKNQPICLLKSISTTKSARLQKTERHKNLTSFPLASGRGWWGAICCVVHPDGTQDLDNINTSVVAVFQKIQMVRNLKRSPFPKSPIVSRRICQGGLQGYLPQVLSRVESCRQSEETYVSAHGSVITISSLILLLWRPQVASRYSIPHLCKELGKGSRNSRAELDLGSTDLFLSFEQAIFDCLKSNHFPKKLFYLN